MTLVVKKYFVPMQVRGVVLARPPHLVLVLPHAHPMLNLANQKATILMAVVKAKVSRGSTRVPLRAKGAAHQVGERNNLGKVVPTAPHPETPTMTNGRILTDMTEVPGERPIACQGV